MPCRKWPRLPAHSAWNPLASVLEVSYLSFNSPNATPCPQALRALLYTIRPVVDLLDEVDLKIIR